jgi:hypothetical protein
VVASVDSGASRSRGRIVGDPPQMARRESRQTSGSPVAASLAAKIRCADSTALWRYPRVLGLGGTHHAEGLADGTQYGGAVDHPVRQLVGGVRPPSQRPNGRTRESGGSVVKGEFHRTRLKPSVRGHRVRPEAAGVRGCCRANGRQRDRRRPPWQKHRSVPPRAVLTGDSPCLPLAPGDGTAAAELRVTRVQGAGTRSRSVQRSANGELAGRPQDGR